MGQIAAPGQRLKEALGLRFEPVALAWCDEKPEGAISFGKGKRGCVMWLFAQAALGKTTAIDRGTYGCPGGGTGLGFGNRFNEAAGGEDGFLYFLSTGADSCGDGELQGRMRAIAGHVTRESTREHILKGERFRKTPGLVGSFIRNLPVTDIPARYVVFMPAREVLPGTQPKEAVITANPHQISALHTLWNFSREGVDTVVLPPGAGCHQLGIYPYQELSREHPRAVIGLTDISARLAVKRTLGDDILTFTIPWEDLSGLEDDIPASFLCMGEWKELTGS